MQEETLCFQSSITTFTKPRRRLGFIVRLVTGSCFT